MKLLLTGGMGFVGHHLVEGALKNTNWDIIILDRLDTSGNPNRLEDIQIWEKEKNRVKFVWWDLKSELNDEVSHEIGKVDYIWHVAASSHVDRSIEDPLGFVLDNVVGTTNLLNWARGQEKLRLFINFSTDEVFGPVECGKSKEYDHHHPKNPYAATKSAQEALGEAFQNCYKLPIITTHTMNVFGERQHPEKFIPSTIRKILNDETVIIHSNPAKTKAAIRSYIHARNVFNALLFLTREFEMNGYRGYDEYNIVGEVEIDALTLALKIAQICNKKLNYEMVDFHSSRPGHDLRYALDGSKLKRMGWKLPKTFNQSLTKTVMWEIDRKDTWL